jgi:hypothetical protein
MWAATKASSRRLKVVAGDAHGTDLLTAPTAPRSSLAAKVRSQAGAHDPAAGSRGWVTTRSRHDPDPSKQPRGELGKKVDERTGEVSR